MTELPLQTQAMMVAQVLLSGILGLIIGFERERRHQGAGLRTITLVAMGSCLFTTLSMQAFPEADTARVAAQIIPGMGFIGAGAILKEGRNVQGLTTAATMWVTAAMGMAVGTGNWFVAFGTTVTIWFVLTIMARFKQKSRLPTGEEVILPD